MYSSLKKEKPANGLFESCTTAADFEVRPVRTRSDAEA
jgi:hypothetical protein